MFLQIEHGSSYPALYRLENRGWIASFWSTSGNKRKAKYYRLTQGGKKQLRAQAKRWEELVVGSNDDKWNRHAHRLRERS
jgi:PadR family transcriptional regulator, regulatory protein PadR